MSIWGRKISTKAVAAVAALMVAAALIPVLARNGVDGFTLSGVEGFTHRPSREIVLFARGMTFYLESDPNTPNPVIEARAGEVVRIVFRNRDRGMTHDFQVPALSAATKLVDWNEDDDVIVDVPDMPGTYEYVCNPHRLMMKGTILVRSR